MPLTAGAETLRKGEAEYARGDFESARILFEEAAESGVIEALYYLSVIYKDGDGVDTDQERARRLFERFIRLLRDGANRGDAACQLRLGRLFQYGDGVLRNDEEAYKWISEGARMGYAPAQFHLSCLFAYGWCGVRQNDDQREFWLDRAASAGLPEAMYQKGLSLANDYFSGANIQARQMAIEWLERARGAGFEEAATILAKVDDLRR